MLTTIMIVAGAVALTHVPALLGGGPAGARVVRVAENLPVNAASGLAIDRSGQCFYVGRPGAGRTGTVEVHTVADGALVDMIPLPGDSYVNALQLSADDTTLYAATSAGGLSGQDRTETVLVIDLARSRVTATVAMPGRVSDLALSPDGRALYAAAGDSLAVIDTDRQAVRRAVPTGQGGVDAGLAVTPDGIWVLVSGSSGIKSVDPVAGVVKRTVGLRDDPAGIAVTPDGTRALIATGNADAVAVLDLASGQVTGSIPVGGRPRQVVITADGAQAVVTNEESGSVSVIDLATDTTSTLSVGSSPDAVALAPDGRHSLVVTSSNVVKLERA